MSQELHVVEFKAASPLPKHRSQVIERELLEIVPGKQDRQKDEPEVENVPGGQSRQEDEEVDPIIFEAVPATQSVQIYEPGRP
jgi:hypothetical protein